MGLLPPAAPGGGDAPAAYEPVLISGAPNFDPSSVYESLVDNGGGSYTVGVNNDTMVNGAGEGAVWVAPMPAGWGGLNPVALRMTIQASAPDNVDLWVGLGVCDLTGDATNAGSDPLVGGVVRQSTADLMMVMTRTAQIVKSGSGGTVVCDMLWIPGSDDLAGGGDIGTISARSLETDLETSRNGGAAADANIRIIVVAGCNDAGATGTHVVGVKLEMGLMSMPTG